MFRRSRTLTGTTSPQVNPSAQKRGQLKTDRLKAHERQQVRQRVLRFLLAIGCGAGVLWYLGAVFIWTPRVTFAEGTHTPASADYQRSIVQILSQPLSERFGFLLPPGKLQAELIKRHSEIKEVLVTRSWYGGEADFRLVFRKPILVWQTGGQRFYVDDQGVAFTYNHFAEPGVVVTDESGIPPEAIGGAVASSRFIRFLGQMVGAVDQYGKGRVTSIIIPSSAREIVLRLEGREFPIRTHIDRDPLEQAEDVAAALTHLDAHKVKPAYLDVRVAHKAFYK
ncbi:MAG TPA: hypothetical protein VFT87_02210 [Candidatus Saccharimonadales bacterium]|nr:hypothetical protein [Candidatus Saccharimonadales bacterium]